MLKELWRYYTTPVPAYVRELGFLYEVIALEARAKRCQQAWQPHSDICKHLIQEAVQQHAINGHVSVLGSGLLTDVPVDYVASNTHRTDLIDIVHLKPALKVLNAYPNLYPIACDITDEAEQFHKALTTGLVHLPPAKTPAPDYLENTNLIISLNLLSQLPLAFKGAAAKRSRNLPKAYGDDLMKAHLEMLHNHTAPCLLITDQYQEYWQDGECVDRSEMTTHLNLGEPFKKWQWHIAPKGEAYKDMEVIHHVAAWWL